MSLVMVLDVGCGSNPWGTVNLDLYTGENEHHRFTYDPRRIQNFTRGDGVKLPYRDKAFDVVVARHCLEHMSEPLTALAEWKRVARHRVIIMVPNNPTMEDYETHLYAWSLPALRNLLGLIFPRVLVYPNSPLSDLYKMRLVKRILRPGGFKKPINRFLGA